MHELGIVIEVVKQVEAFALENNVKTIDTLVLQIGELSSVIPRYIEEVYPIAVEKSMLRNTKLKIEITPGLGKCDDCGFGYNIAQNNRTCPKCSSHDWTVISGKEFNIKEIYTT